MKSKNVYIEILSLTNGLVILYLLSNRREFLYVSIGIALLSILIPRFAFLLGAGLRKILQALGNFMNTMILGIVYIFFLTPVALLYRAFKKKKDQRGKNPNTFFINRDHTYVAEDFNKQYQP